MSDTQQQVEKKRGNRKLRTGKVVSDCQHKTIIVEVVRRTPHPLYKKVVVRKKRFTAHDEKNEAKIGDTVQITEIRPLSKNKKWRLVAILNRGE